MRLGGFHCILTFSGFLPAADESAHLLEGAFLELDPAHTSHLEAVVLEDQLLLANHAATSDAAETAFAFVQFDNAVVHARCLSLLFVLVILLFSLRGNLFKLVAVFQFLDRD